MRYLAAHNAVVAEATDALAVGVGGETRLCNVEGARNLIVLGFLAAIRLVEKVIHRIDGGSNAGVCHGEFDAVDDVHSFNILGSLDRKVKRIISPRAFQFYRSQSSGQSKWIHQAKSYSWRAG